MLTRSELLNIASKAIDAGYRVYAPLKVGERVMIGPVEDPERIVLDHVLTVNTLKDILLPRCETLARFDLDGETVTAAGDDDTPVLILGCRPCDAAALAILDSLLLGDLPDARYRGRRDRAVVMTVACSKCDDACFCTSMGYGPHDSTGSDVLVLPSGESSLLKGLTDGGRAFLDGLGIKRDEAGAADEPPEPGRRVETGEIKAWLDSHFDHPVWQSVSENCVSCGACYYLCPTCHCFDITDEAGISRGERLRIWDACSFSGFTRMASHQPRVGRHARYRQRVMHKFKYCVDNVGKVACVGDGRCIRSCPYGVDICEILKTLQHTE